MNKRVVSHSLFWKLLERGGVQVSQFIVSMVIARLLLPSAYGAIAILMIFISLATVFVQSGLNTALIQKKDADEIDTSSVFFYSLFIALVIYILLYGTAPWIADFFNLPELTPLLRVLALTLFPGAINSIQLAILSKQMDFKKQFYAGIIASVISGAVGIVMAYKGFEAWSLIGQQLSSQTFICLILFLLLGWRPKLEVSFQRTKVLLSFGVKLLGARLIDTLYHNLESFIIGKVFSSATLAYCNKGKQFPLTLIDNIDGSIQSVMLPAYSAHQNNIGEVKGMLRRTISLSTYVVFPIMIVLAAVGSPLIRLVLGENWIGAVPYLRLFCLIAMLFPLQTADLQAINALGKSDVYFKLITWKRLVGVVLLLSSVMVWRSPFAVVVAALIVEVIAILINVPANKKLLHYSFREMMMDILPNLGLSTVTAIGCILMSFLSTNNWVLLISQSTVGIVLYLGVSFMVKNKSLAYLMAMIPAERLKVFNR